MFCPRCRTKKKKQIKMKEIKRKGGFHKKIKFRCPDCGLVRMKKN